MQGELKQGEVISCEGPRVLRPEGMFKQGSRRYWWWWYRWHVGGSLDLCKQPAWRFAPFAIFLTRTCSSWPSVARVAVLGKWSVHPWGITARSGLTFRASAQETWDPTLSPIGQWKPMRKRKSLPHIWLQTRYHWTSQPQVLAHPMERCDLWSIKSSPTSPPLPTDYSTDCTVMLPHKITPSRPW